MAKGNRGKKVKVDENVKPNKKTVKIDVSPVSSSRKKSRGLAAVNDRSNKVQDDVNVKPNKKLITEAASPVSSSRRSSTSSRKQTNETPVKENPTNTRKSVRLDKRNPSDTPQSKEKSKKTQEKTIVTPAKRYNIRNRHVEDPVSSNTNSKKEKDVNSLNECVVDTSKDTGLKKQGLGAGGRKRKRGINKSSSKRKRIKPEADDVNDNGSEEKSTEATTSCSKDLDTELEKPDKLHQLDNIETEYSVSKFVEDKDDSDDECSDSKASKIQSTEEVNNAKELLNNHFMDSEQAAHVDCPSRKSLHGESIESGSGKGSSSKSEKSTRKQMTNHGSVEQQELEDCDTACNIVSCDPSSSKDRTTCEAAGLAEIVENNNGLKLIKSSVPLVAGVAESIWDTREVKVLDTEGLQKQKQYFVKYKGYAHIHNQWVTETLLLLDAPLLVESFSKNGSMKWREEWTVPDKLLKKRLILSLKPLYEGQQNKDKGLNYRYEWLVQWQGLDFEEATWESEIIPVLESTEGHKLIKEYQKHHEDSRITSLSDDKIEDMQVKPPIVPTGCPPGMDNIHLSYVKNLHEAWNKGQTSIVFDDQERTMRIALFIHSLRGVTLPFLLITTAESISQWETLILIVARCNAFKVSLESTNEEKSFRLVEVQNEGGQLAFQLLLYPVDAFDKDLNMLKAINWQAVIVDQSQSSEISSHFSHIKSLSTGKRLLVFCGPLGVSTTSYHDVLSLLDCDVSKTELDDIIKLKETLSKHIAYDSKPSSSKFIEFWVPVQISNVQLEQYCFMLLSNAMALSSCSKSDTVGALHDILVSNRKCCDHPYVVDQSLQGTLTKDLELAKFLDVGIKASGKLQFLDLILPELRKRKLRVLILFQPLSGSGKDSASIGDILDDFIRQRFGEDSYERVDGGLTPSKKQAALNNFNNKDMGRFVFLLEYRACLPSIKLSSVDTVIIFDSDWNPVNDLRALQKITIDSQSEQILIFRLYTSSTLEEKILRLAEHNVTIDSKLQNISRSTSDALLMWGATYLFNKLDDFHNASGVNNSSEEGLWNKLLEEFLNLISHTCMSKDTTKLMITRVQPVSGTYSKNLSLSSEQDEELPHTFWKKLLIRRDPCWKYLTMSNPRQRKSKRPQYFESPTKTSDDDVAHKRKKTANDDTEPVISKPVIEEVEVAGANKSQSAASDSDWCDASDNEASFQDLLKLKISKLCEVLSLSVDVKIMVERFLEYVIENYYVNNEHANTLQAFLISLCWISSALLKHKLDRTQSIALANEHLNFTCNEEEINNVYQKLESAKEMFLRHTDNLQKTDVSEDSIPATEPTSMHPLDASVKEEDPDSPYYQDNEDVDCSKKDAEGGSINPDTSDALENQNDSHDCDNNSSPSAGVSKENLPSVQPLVSPGSGQSVPTDLEMQNETTQENEVQVSQTSIAETSSLLEASSLQPDVGECSPLMTNPTVTESQSDLTSVEQRSDSYSADNVDCQPSNEPPNSYQNPSAPPQVLENNAQVSSAASTSRGPNLLHVQRSDNRDQRVSWPYSDPLQTELEKLCELKTNIIKFHEVVKVKLKSDHEKELAELIAEMNRKYEAKCQDAEAAFQSKRMQIDTNFNKVVKNKVLADAFRSKCQDLSPFDPAGIRVTQSAAMRFHGQTSFGRSTSFSPTQVSGIPQQPPLQIVHQSANLFSSTPTRTPSNTHPSSIPARPPPSTINPTTTPTRPPPNNINPITSSTRPQSNTATTNTASRPPAGVNPITPSGRPNRPPLNINPITPSTRPTLNINPSTHFGRNPRAISEVRTPAPHIQPFRPSTSESSRDLLSHRMSSHNTSSPTSQTSTRPPHLPPLQPQPHFQTNHNSHPTQSSPRALHFSSPMMAQTSSQPPAPAASLPLPSLYSWLPSELQHAQGNLPVLSSSLPQTSLPPMPSISVSNTGPYNASGRPINLRLSALDLLMDIDKQAGLHKPSMFPSQPEFLDVTESGKEGGNSDLVCLSDDD